MVRECLDIDPKTHSLDLIFINNKKQAITFIDSDGIDNERIIDLTQSSLLKSFISNCGRVLFLP